MNSAGKKTIGITIWIIILEWLAVITSWAGATVFVTFLALKLCSIIAWPWIYVFIPIIIPASLWIFFIFFGTLFAGAIINTVKEEHSEMFERHNSFFDQK